MFFDIKNWKNKIEKKEFLKNKKEVLKILDFKKNKKILKEFYFLNQNTKLLKKKILDINESFRGFKKIVLLGTGGSSLGSKAILDANSSNKIIFIENIDPNYVLKKVKSIKEKNILFIIISKSGETSEIISLYQIITSYFSYLIDFKKNILIMTEEKSSTLYKICKEKKIKFLEHNPKIGGRFSCFSETALVPAALAGLNSLYIKNLSDRTIKACLYSNEFFLAENITALYTFIKKKKFTAHTVLVYQESLNSLLMWYRQLWGESLGKNGNGAHIIPAVGSIDQHSQLQMWLDGPDDLFYTIILPKKRKIDYKLKNSKDLIPSYLNKKKLGDILNTMGIATYKTLVKAGKPVRLIYLDNDGLYPAVKLMSFFMLEVAFLGKRLGINPFNQPAVEKVKLLTKKLLIKNG